MKKEENLEHALDSQKYKVKEKWSLLHINSSFSSNKSKWLVLRVSPLSCKSPPLVNLGSTITPSEPISPNHLNPKIQTQTWLEDTQVHLGSMHTSVLQQAPQMITTQSFEAKFPELTEILTWTQEVCTINLQYQHDIYSLRTKRILFQFISDIEKSRPSREKKQNPKKPLICPADYINQWSIRKFHVYISACSTMTG